MNTISTARKELEAALSVSYENRETRTLIAWWLLEHVVKINWSELATKQERTLTQTQQRELKTILEKLRQEYPVQYILKTVPFLGLTLELEPPILIPRPETEYWCHEIIQSFAPLQQEKLTIGDLCTGSGCIGLAFAQAFSKSQVYAVDSNQAACDLAHRNARNNSISNFTVIKGDLFEPLGDLKFDLILSNPPYISLHDWQNLDPSVKNWEDPHALVAENNGLDLIAKILKEAPQRLKKNDRIQQLGLAQVVIEIGATQADAVLELAQNFSFAKVCKDLAGRDRFLVARV